MLQNKIYQNYFIEILRTFLIIVLGLSLIALTVRAVNFLELVVENGYPILTYFQYSFLNLFGIAPKFIPLAFFISIVIFLIKHIDDSEFIILWTSGVKKIELVNLILIASVSVLTFYLLLSTFLTPLALNKSRDLLNKDQLNSFLPTVRSQQFSDSFKGFTFIVDKKINNEVENIFLHDTGKNLQKFSSNSSDVSSTTIVAKKGVIDKRNLFLIDGQIISAKKSNIEVINFEQLDINLNRLSTTTIKVPKLQETSTLKLLSCFFKILNESKICNEDNKKEIIPNLIRRLILPFYIPVVALLCSFLLMKNNILLLDKFLTYSFSFSILVFTELLIRYTGINNFLRFIYIIIPFSFIIIFYFILIYKFKKKLKSRNL
jgi:lipopolysaccharide export system permease protein|tara:strand:+ start:1891 stop:3015 length:1125 start_codon:yes stop_codon:yes gene_type:complete